MDTPHRHHSPRAALAAILLAALCGTFLAPVARADYLLDRAQDRREAAHERLNAHRERIHELERAIADLRRQRGRELRQLRALAYPADQRERFRRMRERSLSELSRRGESLHRAVQRNVRAVDRLQRRLDELNAAIDLLMPLKVCPVRGFHSISDDFGAPRHTGGYHPHQGNDISASYGAPIVAPFDGQATAMTNELGGLGVKVYGPNGHVYNGHLSRLGTLGWVRAGTVIGYVGVSGDATGPHDHFEWHPWNGPAVDPHVYLLRACA
jgi:murein DD-endopeptidase MepM/ murein hydrolase activator NlpD